MASCPNCGYENTDIAQICTRCGELLISPSETAIISDPDPNNEFDPKYGSVRIDNLLKLEVADSEGEFEFNSDEIEELIIGRKDPDTGEFPHVDLTYHGGSEMGVSRRHATIIRREGALHIRDNESANGTYLNGQRLIENQMRVLRDGDDIRLGKLVLHVTFT